MANYILTHMHILRSEESALGDAATDSFSIFLILCIVCTETCGIVFQSIPDTCVDDKSRVSAYNTSMTTSVEISTASSEW